MDRPTNIFICQNFIDCHKKYSIVCSGANEVLDWVKLQLECWCSDMDIDVYIFDINQTLPIEDQKEWEIVEEFNEFMGELDEYEVWKIMEQNIGERKCMRKHEKLSDIWTKFKKQIKKRQISQFETFPNNDVWICDQCCLAFLIKPECEYDHEVEHIKIN